jgi:hypothetical protein
MGAPAKPAAPAAGGDPFGAPAPAKPAAPPAAGADPFGAPKADDNDLLDGADPFGGAPAAKPADKDVDPFADDPKEDAA